MKNWNWKKILQYIAMILGAIGGGAVGGTAYEAATDSPPPAEYSAAPVAAWTVTAWFIAEKKAGGGAVPGVRYTDNLGRYTVRVQSRNRPTDGQVIAAFDKSLDPARVTLEIVEIRKPEGIQEPAPDGPELD